MKVLGIVEWTNRDKGDHQIAGVRPLFELQKGELRPIDAEEEFPSRGRVFWWSAQAAVEGALVTFRVETNPGQKDEFKVVDPRMAPEVLDLRRFGMSADVRAALAAGISLPGPIGVLRVMALCRSDLLVGPVELTRVATGTAKLSGKSLARVPSFTGAQTTSILVQGHERLIRVDDSAPTGYVDWDDNATILRRALDCAVRVAKQDRRDPSQTKRQIEDAVQTLANQGIGPDAQLDRYRLERALALCEDTEFVTRRALELAELLLEHPAIRATLDALGASVRAEFEQSARADLEHRLAREHVALKEVTEAHARMKSQFEVREQELRKAEEQLAEFRSQVASAAKEAETAVDARVLAALDRPLDLLAEVSVLRPFFATGGSRIVSTPMSPTSTQLNWSRARGENIKDKASLRRILTSAARARGVDPSIVMQVHAATAAQLMPVTLGPGALAALAAYAFGACGGRLLIVHASPSAIHPHDFDEVPGGGFVAAAAAAKDIGGISLVVLEGANRSPLEASLVPLLQLKEVGLAPLTSAPGLRLAASLVAGATTVPVTPQLWSYAAAIYAEPNSPSVQASTPGDVALSSELLAAGDEPKDAIAALIDAWPDCGDLRPAMSRYGSALAQLYEDERRVSDILLHGLVLPYIVTAFSIEEQAEALSKAGDSEGSIALALRRLRRRLV